MTRREFEASLDLVLATFHTVDRGLEEESEEESEESAEEETEGEAQSDRYSKTLVLCRPFLKQAFSIADVDGSGVLDLGDVQLLATQLVDLAAELSFAAIEIADHAVAKPQLAALLAVTDREVDWPLSFETVAPLEMLVANGREQIAALTAAAAGGDAAMGRVGALLAHAKAYMHDIVHGLKEIKNEFSYVEMARMAAWDGGVPEHIFVRCLVSAAEKQRSATMALAKEQLDALLAASAERGAPPPVTALGAAAMANLSEKMIASGDDHALMEKFGSSLFALIDLNGDGVLSWHEIDAITALLAGLNPNEPKETIPAAVSTLFGIIDTDMSGDITKGEFLVCHHTPTYQCSLTQYVSIRLPTNPVSPSSVSKRSLRSSSTR